ncbi:MAG: hypothetical protein ABIH01_04475 [Candidatus Omnitrophota bacterium]
MPQHNRYILLTAVIILSFASLENYFFNPKYAGEDWRGVSKYIEQYSRPGDLVLVSCGGATGDMKLVFDYYYKGPIVSLALPYVYGLNLAKAKALVAPYLRGYKRVWLVLSHDWLGQGFYREALCAALEERHEILNSGVKLYLFEKK